MITLDAIKKNPQIAKFFISKKNGGLSPCIIVKDQKDNKGIVDDKLDTLGNCVAFATGMFNFASEQTECKYLGNHNAKNMVTYALKQGLTVTKEPVEGGCLVWDDGKYGHIEYVDEISDDGNICYDLSSGYASYVFANKIRKRDAGGKGQWGFKAPSKYLGCINPPKIETPKAESVVSDPKLFLEVNGKKYQVDLKEVQD